MSWCDDFLLEQSAKKLSGQEVVVTDNPQVIINGVNTAFLGGVLEFRRGDDRQRIKLRLFAFERGKGLFGFRNILR